MWWTWITRSLVLSHCCSAAVFNPRTRTLACVWHFGFECVALWIWVEAFSWGSFWELRWDIVSWIQTCQTAWVKSTEKEPVRPRLYKEGKEGHTQRLEETSTLRDQEVCQKRAGDWVNSLSVITELLNPRLSVCVGAIGSSLITTADRETAYYSHSKPKLVGLSNLVFIYFTHVSQNKSLSKLAPQQEKSHDWIFESISNCNC